MPSAAGALISRGPCDNRSRVRGVRPLRRVAVNVAILAAAAAVPMTALAAAAKVLHLGDTFKVSGYAGRQAQGTVVVKGRWGDGPFQFVTTTRTDRSGHYAFKVKPPRRGTWTLQIVPPDHQAKQFVLRIV